MRVLRSKETLKADQVKVPAGLKTIVLLPQANGSQVVREVENGQWIAEIQPGHFGVLNDQYVRENYFVDETISTPQTAESGSFVSAVAPASVTPPIVINVFVTIEQKIFPSLLHALLDDGGLGGFDSLPGSNIKGYLN
jgi:hypothetical protein